MLKITTFNDLRLDEKLYPHCLRCNKTGKALDVDKIKKHFGEDAPIELVKKYIACKQCGKKDEIILRLISNKSLPVLS